MAASCPHADYRKSRTDGPTKCTWVPGTTEANPHKTIPAYVISLSSCLAECMDFSAAMISAVAS